jgi:hypothetical protein
MDVSITTGNPVYRTSSAVITMNDTFNDLPVSGSGAATTKCWMIDHATSGTNVTSCSQTTASEITIINMAANPAGKQFKFRVLATFGGSGTSSISTATTKIGVQIIDEKSSLLSVARGTTWTKGGTVLIGIATVHATAATPTLTAGQVGTDANGHSLQISQNLGVVTGSTSVLNIVLPLTKTNPGADH